MSACRCTSIPTFTGAFRENLDAMIALMADGHKTPEGKKIGFELERILIDADGRTVPYEGERSVSALLRELAKNRAEDELVHIDGHLLGFDYDVETSSGPVAVTMSLEPAAQLEVSAGPSCSVKALYEAVCAVDAEIERALPAAGLAGAALTAVGYNPCVAAPEDLTLIPKERYYNMDAYLSQRGRYARDMMRCSASTQVSLDYENEADAGRIVRMATFLGPLFAFLFDNAPVFRGKPTPGMARSHIWHHVDVDRCGIVPGSLEGLSFEDYILWVSNVKPILFTDADHVTTPVPGCYARDIMSERPLAKSELTHLLSMVFPNVRLKGFCELREMDSLPPRLAAACTSFMGALLYDCDLEGKLAEALAPWLPQGFAGLDENDCVAARLHLEERAWRAEVYGTPADAFVSAMVAIARENAEDAFDTEGIEMLAEMWGKRHLPRDLGALN